MHQENQQRGVSRTKSQLVKLSAAFSAQIRIKSGGSKE